MKANEIHLEEDARPRLIFNPSPELKVIGAYIARFFIKLMKTSFMMGGAFVSGYNNGEVEKMFQEDALDYCYSYDGGSHDAH